MLCERFPSLNPLSIEEYPAEKVFRMVGNLLESDKKKEKEKKKQPQNSNPRTEKKESNRISVKAYPSKRMG